MKLLLAGGGLADIPLIKAAQNLGYYVITTGNRPEEAGHGVSDEYCPADYSDPEAMLELAIINKIDAICPCCNDFSAISSAYVAEKLGLPGHDDYKTSQLIHHKDSYRDFAHKNSIPTPYAKGFNSFETASSSIEDFHFPVIIKPVDLTGGKGISRADTPESAKIALKDAFAISKLGRVVIEEFIEGSRHGFSAFLRGGKVVFHFTDNEYYYLNQYMVSGASTPATIPSSATEELIKQSDKIAKLLGMRTGIFHVQFILRDDKPIIIEICRRPPGDLYINLVKHSTGVDYPAYIVKSFCGLNYDEMVQKEPDGYYLRHCIMSSEPGILKHVSIDPTIENNIIDQIAWWDPGDHIQNYLVEKFGIVFLKFDTTDELLDKSKKMQTLIHAKLTQEKS